ncbi:cardiolipin synthase B [Aliidiomarina minuta]|uniref:Cardiolipin synthase B n=1 Tax=Aliidiomarina minuta TaxID=880057 RepID=A0A432W150_9GAMM|nr:phospholipase D-like domain-containing protein [Aliidiomarina minuta]RUO22927.1 cardiolipin synthase B [Aliidiomarina minuta]
MAVKRPFLWLVISIMSIVLVVLAINVALFNALPKPIRLVHGLELSYNVQDPIFERSMGALLQNPVQPGNSVEIIRNGENIYPAMIAAIEQAEHSVSFETYEFWGEESAGEISQALADAARRGVQVHALIDFMGSTQASSAKFETLEQAGVHVIRYRSPSWYQLSRINHRTHRKLLITDGSTGFTGGANVADNWLPGPDRTPYRDNHFRIEGPVVANMQAAFAEIWMNASGILLEGPEYFPELKATGDTALQMVKSSPREGRHRVRYMLLYALAAAEESFTASTAYFYPDAAFLEAMRLAAERGVRIRILLPGDTIDQGYLRHASVNRWRPMLEAGVELHEYQTSMYHSKLVSVDDQWATFGSANLDNRSFRINDEGNIAVYSPDFSRQIRELIEEDIEYAERYTLEDWQNRPWHKRIIGWVSSVLGAHF